MLFRSWVRFLAEILKDLAKTVLNIQTSITHNHKDYYFTKTLSKGSHLLCLDKIQLWEALGNHLYRNLHILAGQQVQSTFNISKIFENFCRRILPFFSLKWLTHGSFDHLIDWLKERLFGCLIDWLIFGWVIAPTWHWTYMAGRCI